MHDSDNFFVLLLLRVSSRLYSILAKSHQTSTCVLRHNHQTSHTSREKEKARHSSTNRPFFFEKTEEGGVRSYLPQTHPEQKKDKLFFFSFVFTTFQSSILQGLLHQRWPKREDTFRTQQKTLFFLRSFVQRQQTNQRSEHDEAKSQK